MIRISVGAPMTPNKTFACNDAKSMEGGLLLVKARGWGLFERLDCSPLPQPLKILKVSSHSGTIFYVKPHCYLSHLLLLFLKIWSDQVACMYEVSEGGSRKLGRELCRQETWEESQEKHAAYGGQNPYARWLSLLESDDSFYLLKGLSPPAGLGKGNLWMRCHCVICLPAAISSALFEKYSQAGQTGIFGVSVLRIPGLDLISFLVNIVKYILFTLFLCSPSGFGIGSRCVRVSWWLWVAIPFSRRSSRLRDGTQVSCIAGRFFTIWATGNPNLISLSFLPRWGGPLLLWVVLFFWSWTRISRQIIVHTCHVPASLLGSYQAGSLV